jgi:glycosyltransferase involved in cell wall biosynthesis
MKILEICPFSEGICGVWSRVKQEALELSKKGHEVHIFSSNIEKGTNKKVPLLEKLGKITIRRFNSKKSFFSENVKNFNFQRQLSKLKPSVVITHLLHPHSFKALDICRKNKIPCLLVTHAPFNVKRKFPLNLTTSFWNWKIKSKINKFTKIIAITKWELPYLEKLGIKKNKIKYIPNGIPDEFFTQKKSKNQNKILFLGRISPVKNLELLISVAKDFPKVEFSIVGKAEPDYIRKLNSIKPDNVKIYSPIFDLKKKIKLIDEHKIFILPSKREAMPQSLIESMSREKIVISSATDGGKEIIKDNENGFLFEIGDSRALANKINYILQNNCDKIMENAKNSVKQFKWSILIKKLEEILNDINNNNRI